MLPQTPEVLASMIINKLIDSYTEIERSKEAEETKRLQLRTQLEAFNIMASKHYKLCAIHLSNSHKEKLKVIEIFEKYLDSAIKNNETANATVTLELLSKLITPVPDYRLDSLLNHKMIPHQLDSSE